jgi:tetratricopeptide (TPR) repeat protein
MRLTAKICAILIVLIVGGSLWSQAQSPRAAIAAALQEHNFPQALELLRPAVQASPRDPELWAMQGAAYAGENDKPQALASYHHALQISPDYLPALHGAAQIEFEAGSARGIPLLQRIVRLQPGDKTGHGMLAVLEYQEGNCVAAVPHFEKAAELFDSQPGALHAYGVCLVKLKRPERAVPAFERTVALQPNDAQERRLLAAVQMMAHKPQDALVTLQPLLQSSPPDAAALSLASSAYEDAGKTDEAVSALRQAILLEPHNIDLYLEFASLSAEHQSFQVGINVVDDGINLQPKAAPLYFARGVLYVQVGQYDKAEADFEQAYALDPSQSLSAAAQGLAAVQSNDLDRALAAVQKKLAAKPQDPLLLYVQADILTQKGPEPSSPEFQTALRSAQKAVALQPTLAAAHGVLAKLYLQSGQYKSAAEECRKVLAADPADQSAVYRLIQALRRTGDKQEIPGLLKRLAELRQQATKEERQRDRYKLVEGDAAP